MGCVASSPTKPSTPVDHHQHPAKETSGGSHASHTNTVIFKVLPSETEARRKFEGDGTLVKNSDTDHLALRTMLDEPLSQNALGKFAAKTQSLDIFMCWIDIQEYKTIPTESYRRSKALHIYQKYIKKDAPLMLCITDQERQRIEDDVFLSKTAPAILNPGFYDHIQAKCFLDMYYNIYLAFKQTPEFHQLTIHLKNKYNRVKLTDFEYYNKLGEGGFGFVVHCKKKSTGKHFAMKIQTKLGLLDCFKDDIMKINIEKDAFASLQHPFIVNLNYAFQTPTMVMMVLDLADCGDLNECCHNSPTMMLSEERVRFYAAEIILALAYLHQRGLVYRDLKPQNVLLNCDGHVQLVDLGGVMDDGGLWTEKYRSSQSHVVPLFSGSKKHHKQTTDLPIHNHQLDEQFVPTAIQIEHDGKEVPEAHAEIQPATPVSPRNKQKHRRQSVMGTLGYMAPEMVLMLNQSNIRDLMDKHATKDILREGYTQAVDWWSLGVTIYKLITGQRPFNDQQFYDYVDMKTTLNHAVSENINFAEYAMLFQKINYPSHVSNSAKTLINALLDVNDKTRLGYGPQGVQDIKKHAFFKDIDWDLLEQKQIEPPFRPTNSSLQELKQDPVDLRALLTSHGKENFFDQAPSDPEQKYFENWDFIAPQTLRIEAGLSQMMGQLVRNMKARQLMGDPGDVRNPEQAD